MDKDKINLKLKIIRNIRNNQLMVALPRVKLKLKERNPKFIEFKDVEFLE